MAGGAAAADSKRMWRWSRWRRRRRGGFFRSFGEAASSPGITQDAALNWLTFFWCSRWPATCRKSRPAGAARSCAPSRYSAWRWRLRRRCRTTPRAARSSGFSPVGSPATSWDPFANPINSRRGSSCCSRSALPGPDPGASGGRSAARRPRRMFRRRGRQHVADGLCPGLRRGAGGGSGGGGPPAGATQGVGSGGASNSRSWQSPPRRVAGWQGLEDRLQVRRPESVRVDAVKGLDPHGGGEAVDGQRPGTWSIVYPRYAGFDAGVFVNQAHNDWAQWSARADCRFFFLWAGFAALLWKPAHPVDIWGGIGGVFCCTRSWTIRCSSARLLAAWFFAMAGVAAAWRNGPARKP